MQSKSDGPMQKLDDIMRHLDDWVSRHGDVNYVDPDFEPMKNFSIPPDNGIQQERREIETFVGLLLKKGLNGMVLEIGLGYFGSTHFLWRLLFDRVVTIEKNHDRIRAFGRYTQDYYGKWVLDDGCSSFVIGLSYEPDTVAKVYKCVEGQIDMLFIDGDHAYSSVLTDWLLYHDLVRPGGIIALHDSVLTMPGYYGVPALLEQLRAGKIDGKNREIRNIVFSKNLGIGCYEQV